MLGLDPGGAEGPRSRAWVTAEPVDQHRIGEVARPPLAGQLPARAGGLFDADGAGELVILGRVQESSLEQYTRERVAQLRVAQGGGGMEEDSEDARTLSVLFNSSSKRGRRFADTVDLM